MGDLLEWIANSRPEDELAIRKEIKRLYYDVGDTHGGDAMNRALSDVLESGGNRQEREGVFDEYDAYTRADPAEVAMFGRNLLTGALLPVPELPPEIPSGAGPWK